MKKLILGLFVLFSLFNGGFAHADAITATFTGDDNVSYWNGSSWVAEGSNWQLPETIDLSINQSSETIYFAVSNNNWVPGGDPAGFLASFTDTDGTFEQTGTSTLLSSSATFKVLTSAPWTITPGPFSSLSQINPTVNPNTLTGWVTPTEYGANGSGSTIWDSVNEGPLSGIDPNAQWIWSANNTSWDYATTDDYDFIEVNLGVDPLVTPEPPTVLLFAFAGICLLFGRFWRGYFNN